MALVRDSTGNQRHHTHAHRLRVLRVAVVRSHSFYRTFCHLRIRGHVWRVELNPDLDARGLRGLCHIHRHLIEIDPCLPEHEFEEVLLHEVLHATLPAMRRLIPHTIEERIVTAMALELVHVLPQLAKLEPL